MELKINDSRKATYIEKWKLNNKEGWEKFNKAIADEQENSPHENKKNMRKSKQPSKQ